MGTIADSSVQWAMAADHGKNSFPYAAISQASETLEGSPMDSPTSGSSRKRRLRRRRFRGHSYGFALLSAVASVAAVVLLITLCSRNQMRNHLFASRTRQLSDKGSPKRRLENVCGSASDEASAWLESDDDSDSDADEPLQKKPHLMAEAMRDSQDNRKGEGLSDAGEGAGATAEQPALELSHGSPTELLSSLSGSPLSSGGGQWTESEIEVTAALFQLREGRSYSVDAGPLESPGDKAIYLQETETSQMSHQEGRGAASSIIKFITSAGAVTFASGATSGQTTEAAPQTAAETAAEPIGGASGQSPTPYPARTAIHTPVIVTGSSSLYAARPAPGRAAGPAAGPSAGFPIASPSDPAIRIPVIVSRRSPTTFTGPSSAPVAWPAPGHAAGFTTAPTRAAAEAARRAVVGPVPQPQSGVVSGWATGFETELAAETLFATSPQTVAQIGFEYTTGLANGHAAQSTNISTPEGVPLGEVGRMSGPASGPSSGIVAGPTSGLSGLGTARTAAGATAGDAAGPSSTPADGVEAGPVGGNTAEPAAGSADEPQPGTSQGTDDPLGAQHPYYRLPKVPTKGFVSFNPERALIVLVPPMSPLALLSTAHDLLIKPQLTVAELQNLATTTELLISHAILYQRREPPHHRPSRAAGMLAVRFLMFDIIVSTLQLLRQRPSGTWWMRLVLSVPHRYSHTSPQEPAKVDVKFNRGLISCLTQALGILKRGQRLSSGDTIKLKQLLFSSPYSPLRLRKRAFDAWRSDLNTQ
ncbi:hypothetical protein, conserved [Eimeria praecox]|uniref:Transmembrane protein n=1 Tax=Eimeria praecox TaxID=51316 RepID=U6GPS6_9EIME|nr:hypothetical protein, conserved [Eimeria praecox]